MPRPVLSINVPATKHSVSHLLVFGNSSEKIISVLGIPIGPPLSSSLARSLDPLRASKVERPLGQK